MQPDRDVAPDGNRFLLVQSEPATIAGGRNMVKRVFNWFEDFRTLLATPW